MPRRYPSFAQLVLLVLLAAVVIVWLRGIGSRDRESGRHGPQGGPAFDERSVDAIEFRRGGSFVRVVREEGLFWITEPYRDRADDRFLAQSLRVAATLRADRVLPDTQLALFGLDPPAAVWSCRWVGGAYEIALGDTLPAGGGRFARTSGRSEVIVVDPFLARRYLSPPANEIHEPIAAPLDVGRVDSVRIETREEQILVVRREAGSWEILAPIRVEASAREIDRVVQTLRSESMTGYLGPCSALDLRALGLEPPRATWTLIQARRRAAVRIGHPTEDQRSVHIVPADREVVALIGSGSFRIWVDGITRLREPRLMRIPADSVTSVETAGWGVRRRFVRSPAGIWKEESASDALPVRPEPFERAVANLAALQASAFLPGGEGAALRPDILVLVRSDAGRVDTLEIASPQGDYATARASAQPGFCQVPAQLYRTWEVWLRDPLRP